MYEHLYNPTIILIAYGVRAQTLSFNHVINTYPILEMTNYQLEVLRENFLLKISIEVILQIKLMLNITNQL